MLRVYANLQIFLVFFAVFLLSGCISLGGYGGPWGQKDNAGIVTSNPENLPNMAWQTEKQRKMLAEQNLAIANQAAAAAAPATAEEGNAAAAPSRKTTVTLLLPLSGKKSALGQSMLKAAQMALFDIGSANFELVPRDTKSTKEGAVAAATAAINAQTDLILGPVFADDLKAVKPLAGNAGVPVISFTTDWTLGGDNTYIMGFLPFAQVTRVAKYAQDRGYSRFAVYAPQTEYCDAVINTLQDSGISVVHVNRYSPQQPDLAALVQDFAATSKDAAASGALDFDALMLPLGSEGLRTLVSTLGSNGISQPKVKFVGTGLWDDATLTGDPMLFGGWFAAPDPALRADFEKRFQENFGSVPLRLSSLAYDATALAAVLARTASEDSSPYTQEALTNPRGFAGIDGIFRFRADGISERGLAVLEIRSGKPKVIDRAPTAFIASES